MTGSARGRVPRTHPADVLVAEAAAVGCVRLDGSLSLHLRLLLASKIFVLSCSRRSAMVHFFASFTLSPPRPDEGREGQRYRGKKQKRKPHKEREGQRHRGKKQKGKNSTRASRPAPSRPVQSNIPHFKRLDASLSLFLSLVLFFLFCFFPQYRCTSLP